MEKHVTREGVEHGLVETIANSVPDHGYKNLSEKHRKEMLDKKKNDLELVEIVYHHLKNQDTGKFEGWYADHPGTPMYYFRLLYGLKYKIPKGMAKKINNLGAPQRSGLVDSRGNELLRDGVKERTHQVSAAAEF